MKKNLPILIAAILLLAAQLACAIGQSSPASTPDPDATFVPMLYPDHITPQSGIGSTPSVATTTPAPEYVRQQPIQSSNLCILSAEPDSCVVLFNQTGVMTGITYERASRELKWGYDIALDTVAALAFDPIDNRMEVLLLDNSMTEIRFVGGNVLACKGLSDCWGSYSTTTGIPLDEAPTYLEYLGMKLMADAIIDARALSAMGQLCFVESGKEISFLNPCHTAISTMIPEP